MELMGTKATSKEPSEKGLCFKCNQSGHRQANCPGKSSGGVKRNHGTQSSPPARCPACGSHHTGKDADGKLWYKNRLSACNVFWSKTPEERAAMIAWVEGCALCLD